MKRISILGATGSVGQSTADVILAQPREYDVQVVTAHRNVQGLAETAQRLKAKKAVIADAGKFQELKDALSGTSIDCAAGEEALLEAASQPADWIMAAIVGMAGLRPVLNAIRQGTVVAIANKEPLVAAGPLILQEAAKAGAKIIPVDSEHNAIFQVFNPESRTGVERLILTASGGPFLRAGLSEMQGATPEQALRHPAWSMGAKISIDSATMMNKALEVIEAHYLFDIDPADIDVLIHPQCIVHSMVEYTDGSILAQMGASDMRTPIASALGWPQRIASPGRKLDLKVLKEFTFEDVDSSRFPSISMAYDCLSAGQGACVALNAANEVAVEAFLNREIPLTEISRIVSVILEKNEPGSLRTPEDIICYDERVRDLTRALIQQTGQWSRVA